MKVTRKAPPPAPPMPVEIVLEEPEAFQLLDILVANAHDNHSHITSFGEFTTALARALGVHSSVRTGMRTVNL